jgi:hypothetical protein
LLCDTSPIRPQNKNVKAMKHNKDNWIAALKKAVKDVNMPPTSGLPCAIASARIIRDGVLADCAKGEVTVKDANGKDKVVKAKPLDATQIELVKASVLELIQDLGRPDCKVAGFASNASAAAKAAELETSAAANLASKLSE